MTLYYLVYGGIEQQATLQYETIFLSARFQLLKIMGFEADQYESLLPSHKIIVAVNLSKKSAA